MKIGAKKGGIDAHHCSGVEEGADSALGVISHDETAELQAGIFHAVGGIIPQAHRGVIVFQVGTVRTGSQVTPLPYHGIADKAIVGFVRVPDHHHIGEFSSHFAMRPYGGGTIDLGIYFRDRMFARSLEPSITSTSLPI